MRYIQQVLAKNLQKDVKEAAAWLSKYNAHDYNTDATRPACPTSKILKVFEEFVPTAQLVLFRGLRFFYTPEQARSMPRLNSTYHYTDKQCSSWTTNLGTAVKFARGRELGFVVTATIAPKDIVVDVESWMDAYPTTSLKWSEHEIIVKPISISTKVAFTFNLSRNQSKLSSKFR